MFRIEFSNSSKNFMKKADKILVKRIFNKIDSLKITPILHDTKILFGEDTCRVRVGDYRILYVIDYLNKVILITKIDKRERVYN